MGSSPELHPTDAADNNSDEDSNIDIEDVKLLFRNLYRLGMDPKEAQTTGTKIIVLDEILADLNQDFTPEKMRSIVKQLLLRHDSTLDTYGEIIFLMEKQEDSAERISINEAQILSYCKTIMRNEVLLRQYGITTLGLTDIKIDEKFMSEREEIYRVKENLLSEGWKVLQNCKDVSARVRFLRDEFKSECLKMDKLVENFVNCSDVSESILNLTDDLFELAERMMKADVEIQNLMDIHSIGIAIVMATAGE
ncbi:hypothetical protein QAD02_010791 [Eretmocerus hayati]|uniref:Uncharacterized protein n=1 Tax=Eretmocerus hayati TaxID=131215 RepID=A0ACC2NUY1_9HYME|nr:hypothetical protein QAD02_010791 [Eretmocerus hayati]